MDMATGHTIQRLAELEARFDGIIPPDLLAIAQIGSPEMAALMAAIGNVEFYRNMTLRQIETIRARREDGTYYSALLTDLRFYRRYHRAHVRHLHALRRIVAAAHVAPLAA